MTTLILRAIRFSYSKTKLQKLTFCSSQSEKTIDHKTKHKIGKVVNVAIIGAPNSGKSTIINNITERKICAASNKVHTTTKMARAMCFHEGTQIIFLDTPGIVTEKEQKKYNLPTTMIGACHKGLRCADVVGVVHDVSNRYTKDGLYPDVINMLEITDRIPSFLILNKIDKLKFKKQLLSIIRNLCNGVLAGNPIPGTDKVNRPNKGYSHFSDVFIVSALNGDGMQDIKQYLINNAKPANYHYSPDEWTDQTPEQIIEEAVRAKFLDFLPQEIPYNLKVDLDYYEDNEDENKIISSVVVLCPSERLLKLIAGAGGGRLQQIKTNVRSDLMEAFKKPVVLDLQLKTREKPAEILVSTV